MFRHKRPKKQGCDPEEKRMAVEDYKPGLEGVPVAKSSISYVNGQEGILEYRGIPIDALAHQSNFVETAYLLIWGRLPSAAELAEFENIPVTKLLLQNYGL